MTDSPIARLRDRAVPRALRHLAPYATLKRSFGLLGSFRYEQPEPARFYGHLAEDTVALLEGITAGVLGDVPADGASPAASPLAGARILDVGGGPGYFADAFAARGAEYISCEPDVGEMAAAGIRLASSVRGSGLELPFRTGAFDLTYSSNVAEHVAEPWRMGLEMLRVTRPGGLVVLSYTIWFGPFGGHEMGLTHYLGGDRARRMYERRHGKRPKNYYGESLFRVDCAEGLAWAREMERSGRADLLACFPRYHPWWAWWMTRVPVFREAAVSNLVIVLRKR